MDIDIRKLCKDCNRILDKYKIESPSDFKSWASKNHPNKGGNKKIFKEVSKCNDLYFGLHPKCLRITKQSVKSRKTRKSRTKPRKPCNKNQVRNPKTKRCVLKSRLKSRKAPSRRKSRKVSSSRRKSRRKSVSKRKVCSKYQVRNPKTGRCIKKSKAKFSYKSSVRSTKSAKSARAKSQQGRKGGKCCFGGKIINPETGKCINPRGATGRKLLNEGKIKVSDIRNCHIKRGLIHNDEYYKEYYGKWLNKK